jgi:iron complex outermembrane receptor protein
LSPDFFILNMRKFLFLVGCTSFVVSFSQGTDTVFSSKFSDPAFTGVTVEAFVSRTQWKTVPASVAMISSKDMNRYAGISLVPVLNTIPGVRMEERSPASYRLSFRGSLLRSPFGVRNVKVYWNGIPLTDGGGNTYLNLVDMGQIRGAEILKGPVASVYGAGTGGALLLQSAPYHTQTGADHSFNVGVTGGSYGLFYEQAAWEYKSYGFSSSLQQSHQQSDGYREQSGTRKDVVKYEAGWQWKQQQLHLLAFYTDLYYQTPGGITLAQMQTNPKLSRQPAGALPGSIQQKTAIYNKTIFGGVHHEAELGGNFSLRSFITGNHTSFQNPFITNYEKRDEKNFGAGTNLILRVKDFQWMNGMEWLYNQSAIDNYGNRSGVPDTVQYKDNVFANQWFAFSQAQFTPGHRWNLTAGISINNQSYRYSRLTDPSPFYTTKSNKAVVTPRVALSYKLNNDISLYALAAKGFSPPALAEFRPSDGKFHGDLDAEYGWNYELGIKGELADQKLQFDIAVYFFRLQNAIVRRIDSTGAEFFINAGSTKQNGLEVMIKYDIVKRPASFVKSFTLWSSYSYQPYRFEDYQQGTAKYSGNRLTGVPRHIVVSGFDMTIAKGWYLNASVNYTSSLPLTDANDVYAEEYTLVQIKAGYRSTKRWHLFAGIDNLFDEVYSLGNDINALGRRYYNPATDRNIFAGIQMSF